MDITAMTLTQLLAQRKKGLSAVEITEAYLEKALINRFNSFITVTAEHARARAKQTENADGAFAGIPCGIKDNICTAGIRTTCASRMLENFVPPYSAHVVKKLDQAGCVMLGKLNMDEFAMGSSTQTSCFGSVLNPCSPDRVPGGSSGGSAAAVAAHEVPFALGSDTGGSIRQPAAFCGVVGMKPTYGRVSRNGLVAFASSLDQIGPITRTVEDNALVLGVISGKDPGDSTSLDAPHSFSSFIGKDIRGLKIGILTDAMDLLRDADTTAAVNGSIALLERLGAVIVPVSMPTLKNALSAYYILSCAEASSNLARFDGVKYGYRAEDYTDLTDMYLKTRSEGFGSEVKRRIMLGTYALSAGYYDAYYKKAQQARTLIRNSFAAAFEKFDVVLTPTTPTTAFEIGKNITDPITMYLNDICTVSVNIAGLPAISIPCGCDKENMPIGLQLIAKPFGEDMLFKTAYAFEQSTDFSHKCLEGEGK